MSISFLEISLINEVNFQRIIRGKEPLNISRSACNEARIHSNDMIMEEREFPTYDDSFGENTLMMMIMEEREFPTYDDSFGENTLIIDTSQNGQVLVSKIVHKWMDGYYLWQIEHMLNERYVSTGAGIVIADGRAYVTQRFYTDHRSDEISSMPKFPEQPKVIIDRWGMIEL